MKLYLINYKRIATRLIFSLCLLILSQITINAQSGHANKYLYKVGIADSIYSNILGASRDIYIQVPDSYNDGSNKEYPVVYVLDGEVFLPTVTDVMNYYSGGFIPEMIIVAISNNKHRTRDLTTSTITSKYGMPFTEENGKASVFLSFMVKELIPYIEKNYRVTGYRTLIGHSYGGLFTIYTMIYRTDIFDNYLSIDPSLDWDDQKLIKQSNQVLASNDFTGKALFMSLSGQLHMQNSDITLNNLLQDTSNFTLFARSNVEFANTIRENKNSNLSFDWKFYPEEIHGTIPFVSIRDGLISLFSWFQMENTDMINSFDTSKEELMTIVKHREKKLKDHFGYKVAPYPEEILNMSGYMNMDMKQFEKAKMYFELAIEYFPQSANAYDSMADYYLSVNDNKNALKNLKLAFDISGDNYYKNRIEEIKTKSKFDKTKRNEQ